MNTTITTVSDEEVLETVEKSIDGFTRINQASRLSLEKQMYAGTVYEAWYRKLLKFPALARVVYQNLDTDEIQQLFVCPIRVPPAELSPNSDLANGIEFASDMTQLAKAASRKPGDELCVRISRDEERSILILEVDKFDNYSGEVTGDTDGRVDAVMRLVDRKPNTILGLGRDLLESLQSSAFDDDDWGDDESTSSVIEGVKRALRTDFGLSVRVVDSVQDDIFRSPINTSIILLGPAGTGKTTTMAQRLRHKMYASSLDEDDQYFLSEEELQALSKLPYYKDNDKWLIFTPTELLKQYVKNALDEQGLGNLSHQMCTWSDYSTILGRQHLGILNTKRNGPYFVRSEPEESVTDKTRNDWKQWINDFSSFRTAEAIRKIRDKAKVLAKATDPEISSYGNDVLSLTEESSIITVIAKLFDLQEKTTKLFTRIKDREHEQLEIQFDLCKRKNKNLGTLFKDILAKEKAKMSTQDEQDTAADEEDEVVITGSELQKEMMKTILRHCAHVTGRNVQKPGSRMSSRFQLLSAWLPSAEKSSEIDSLNSHRTCIGTVRRFFDNYLNKSLVQSYKQFRRSEKYSIYYNSDAVRAKPNRICQAELDLLILNQLAVLRELYLSPIIRRRYGERLSESVRSVCKMMVFVDEATDFSPVQLAAMYHLAHPDLQSFFACGDINQRLTSCGIRNIDDLKWAAPSASFKFLKTSYRQTRQLHELGQKLLELSANTVVFDDSGIDEDIIDENIRPQLVENLTSLEDKATAVADSICDILEHYPDEKLPTVAIFVPTQGDVIPFASQLKQCPQIVESNLTVIACADGQSMPSDAKIGVYPIEFVKGLEFESVMFVDLDKIEAQKDFLSSQYMYVGVTRASIFFSIFCEGSLPERLQSLRHMFCDSWK